MASRRGGGYGWVLLGLAAMLALTPPENRIAVRVFELAAFAAAGQMFAALPAPPAALLWPGAALAMWPAGVWLSSGVADAVAAAEALLLLAALLVFFWSAYAWLRAEGNREWFLDRFAAFGAGLTLLSAAQYFTAPGSVLWLWPAAYPDVFGPFANRNHYAAFAGLVAPVVALRGRSGPWWAGAILMCGLASGSRAWSVLFVLEAAWIGAALWQRAPGRRWLAGLGAGLLGGGLLAGGVLSKRWAAEDLFAERREIVAATWDMIGARPWTGHGIGTFALVYPEYRKFDNGASVEHAHCDWLELAAEIGGVGAALATALAARAIVAGLRVHWGAGLAFVGMHAFVDYPLRRLNVGIWVLLVAAAATAAVAAQPGNARRFTGAGSSPGPPPAEQGNGPAAGLIDDRTGHARARHKTARIEAPRYGAERRSWHMQKWTQIMIGGALGGAILAAGEARVIGSAAGPGISLDGTGSSAASGTLRPGTLVTSGAGAATIRLQGGTILDLGARGEARLYESHAELRRGVVRIRAGRDGYRVLAANLGIVAAGGTEAALVGLDGAGRRVEVAAGSASLKVESATGAMVATIPAGEQRSFEPAASGESGRVQVSGCLRSEGRRLWLVDETSNLTFEVAGAGLEKEVGNRVQIAGGNSPVAPQAGAAYRIEARSWSRLGKGCDASAGKAAAAGTSAGRAASGGTLIAIVGGVAIAAAMGGLVAAGSFTSGGTSTPPLSR